jgi:hypothetical protein
MHGAFTARVLENIFWRIPPFSITNYGAVENRRANIRQKLGLRGHKASLKYELQHKSGL